MKPALKLSAFTLVATLVGTAMFLQPDDVRIAHAQDSGCEERAIAKGQEKYLPPDADNIIADRNPNTAPRAGLVFTMSKNDIDTGYTMLKSAWGGELGEFTSDSPLSAVAYAYMKQNPAKFQKGYETAIVTATIGEARSGYESIPLTGPNNEVISTTSWAFENTQQADWASVKITDVELCGGEADQPIPQPTTLYYCSNSVCESCLEGNCPQGVGATSNPLTCNSCSPPPSPKPACSDGTNNDEDTLVDFPSDPGCESKDDTDETDEKKPDEQVVKDEPPCPIKSANASFFSRLYGYLVGQVVPKAGCSIQVTFNATVGEAFRKSPVQFFVRRVKEEKGERGSTYNIIADKVGALSTSRTTAGKTAADGTFTETITPMTVEGAAKEALVIDASLPNGSLLKKDAVCDINGTVTKLEKYGGSTGDVRFGGVLKGIPVDTNASITCTYAIEGLVSTVEITLGQSVKDAGLVVILKIPASPGLYPRLPTLVEAFDNNNGIRWKLNSKVPFKLEAYVTKAQSNKYKAHLECEEDYKGATNWSAEKAFTLNQASEQLQTSWTSLQTAPGDKVKCEFVVRDTSTTQAEPCPIEFEDKKSTQNASLLSRLFGQLVGEAPKAAGCKIEVTFVAKVSPRLEESVKKISPPPYMFTIKRVKRGKQNKDGTYQYTLVDYPLSSTQRGVKIETISAPNVPDTAEDSIVINGSSLPPAVLVHSKKCTYPDEKEVTSKSNEPDADKVRNGLQLFDIPPNSQITCIYDLGLNVPTSLRVNFDLGTSGLEASDVILGIPGQTPRDAIDNQKKVGTFWINLKTGSNTLAPRLRIKKAGDFKGSLTCDSGVTNVVGDELTITEVQGKAWTLTLDDSIAQKVCTLSIKNDALKSAADELKIDPCPTQTASWFTRLFGSIVTPKGEKKADPCTAGITINTDESQNTASISAIKGVDKVYDLTLGDEKIVQPGKYNIFYRSDSSSLESAVCTKNGTKMTIVMKQQENSFSFDSINKGDHVECTIQSRVLDSQPRTLTIAFSSQFSADQFTTTNSYLKEDNMGFVLQIMSDTLSKKPQRVQIEDIRKGKVKIDLKAGETYFLNYIVDPAKDNAQAVQEVFGQNPLCTSDKDGDTCVIRKQGLAN